MIGFRVELCAVDEEESELKDSFSDFSPAFGQWYVSGEGENFRQYVSRTDTEDLKEFEGSHQNGGVGNLIAVADGDDDTIMR